MKERGQGYFQVSLMNVFRQSAADRDAKLTRADFSDQDRVLNQRSIERREGAGEGRLRDHLAQDLANLLSTVHLEAVVPMAGLEHVRASILNYGMQDMTRLTTADITNAKVMRDLRAALIAHEPRLIAESLVVKLRETQESADQRIAFDITAEMSARPVDVPLQFVAEIDIGAGKVALGGLAVQG